MKPSEQVKSIKNIINMEVGKEINNLIIQNKLLAKDVKNMGIKVDHTHEKIGDFITKVEKHYMTKESCAIYRENMSENIKNEGIAREKLGKLVNKVLLTSVVELVGFLIMVIFFLLQKYL